MNDEWSYGQEGAGSNLSSGSDSGLSFLPATTSSSSLSSDNASQFGISGAATGRDASAWDWLSKAGGGALNWISQNPGTAGLLGLAGYNATKKPQLPGSLQQLQSNLGPVQSYGTNILNSQGQLNPTQKAAIDASYNQQLSDAKGALLQNAQTSGMGADSLITKQQLEKRTQELEGQRQQLYMQAQQQNISQALQALGISNQGLSEIARVQLAQDQNAQQLAGQFANTASKLYALSKQGGQDGGGGGGGAGSLASTASTAKSLYNAYQASQAGAGAEALGATQAGSELGAGGGGAFDAWAASQPGIEAGTGATAAGSGAQGASAAGASSGAGASGAALGATGGALLAAYLGYNANEHFTARGMEGANRTLDRLQQGGVNPDYSQMFSIDKPWESLSNPQVLSMLASGQDLGNQYAPNVKLNDAYVNQLLASNPQLGALGVSTHDLGGDFLTYIANQQLQPQKQAAQAEYDNWLRQYMYAPRAGQLSATQGGG